MLNYFSSSSTALLIIWQQETQELQESEMSPSLKRLAVAQKFVNKKRLVYNS